MALDALASGSPELAPEQAKEVRCHLDECARCRAELQALALAQDRFRREVFRRTLPVVERRRGRARWRSWLLPMVVTLPAVLLLVVATLPARHVVRAKGGATMQVVARRAERVFSVADGASLRPGDALRFVVAPSALPYLLVASIDGAGHASIYFPPDGAQSGRVSAGERVELPGSIVLDDSPGPERLFALWSRTPLPAARVVEKLETIGRSGPQALRAARTLGVGAEEETTLIFEKTGG